MACQTDPMSKGGEEEIDRAWKRVKQAEARMRELRSENETMKEELRKAPKNKDEEEKRLQEEIKNARTLEGFEKVKGFNWTETQFENVKMVMGNQIMSREETVAKCVIVEPDDGAMDKSIQKMYRDRFPELCDSDRDFETFVVKMGRGEEQRQTTRKLVKIKIDGTDGNLWEQVTKLRAEMEGEGIGRWRCTNQGASTPKT
jgi:hypothetical protein